MKEVVLVDGVRSPNGRAHAEKGWFRNRMPDELLVACYHALFARNPQVKPEMVEAAFIGTANQGGVTNDMGRLAWLAAGLPESVAANSICQQCPSGMSATEHAARAIMCGEGDIYVVGGVEDMGKMPKGMYLPQAVADKYGEWDLQMGPTAEKVAAMWNVSVEDMNLFAYWSNKNAAAARDAGAKFVHGVLQGLYVSQGTDRGDIPTVKKGMQVDSGESLPLGHFQQRNDVVQVAVDSTIRNQTHQVQSAIMIQSIFHGFS